MTRARDVKDAITTSGNTGSLGSSRFALQRSSRHDEFERNGRVFYCLAIAKAEDLIVKCTIRANH